MQKAIVSLLAIFSLIAGCAAPPQAAPQASTGSATSVTSVNANAAQNDNENYETVFVPPPVGSLLGGGAVRVPKRALAGTDETALLGNIRRLNAAAGSTSERPFVVSAVSRATGVSERQLQAQQDALRMRFGELCAINAIARGDSNRVRQIATQKARGQSWAQVAQSNGANLAAVVQTTRNAAQMTAESYSNAAERAKGGQRKLEDMGIHPQHAPGNG